MAFARQPIQGKIVKRTDQSELPPLPGKSRICECEEYAYTDEDMRAYAGAVRKAERQRIESELAALYDLLSIGAAAREPHVLLHNVENVKRRAECLSVVEREFFMVAGEPDEDFSDGEPADECLLRWGADAASYVEQFRIALDRIRPAVGADDAKALQADCSNCGGFGSVTGDHPDIQCSVCAGTGKVAPQTAEPVVRYCPGCGSIGPVSGEYKNCCPDGDEARVIPKALAEKCRDTFQVAILAMLAEQAANDAPLNGPVK